MADFPLTVTHIVATAGEAGGGVVARDMDMFAQSEAQGFGYLTLERSPHILNLNAECPLTERSVGIQFGLLAGTVCPTSRLG
jgi:hypothetical protein